VQAMKSRLNYWRPWLIAAAAGLCVAACSTPSQKYGLPPPSDDLAYPNINMDPAVRSEEVPMTPEQRDAAEAELERRAGKKPAKAN
jgi:hypothetical protein